MGGQKLIADVHIIPVEEILIEIAQLFSGERLGGVRGSLGRGKGAGPRQSGQQGGGQYVGHDGLGIAGNAGDAVLELLFARGHGGGGEQRIGGCSFHRHQRQQGAAVVQPLVVPQVPQGPFVTGQLAVGAGHDGGHPHQRVEPVDRQAHAAQERPERVQMTGVGLLVEEDMAQPLRRGYRFRREVNGGPEESEEAGGGQVIAQVDRAGAMFRRIGDPLPAQLSPEDQVAAEEEEGGYRHAALPHPAQHLGNGSLFGVLGHRLSVLRENGIAEAVPRLHHLAGPGGLGAWDLSGRGLLDGHQVDRLLHGDGDGFLGLLSGVEH